MAKRNRFSRIQAEGVRGSAKPGVDHELSDFQLLQRGAPPRAKDFLTEADLDFSLERAIALHMPVSQYINMLHRFRITRALKKSA